MYKSPMLLDKVIKGYSVFTPLAILNYYYYDCNTNCQYDTI